MTVRERLAEMLLDEFALNAGHSGRVLENYLNGPLGGPMKGRLDDRLEDYPPALFPCVWMGVETAAEEYLAALADR